MIKASIFTVLLMLVTAFSLGVWVGASYDSPGDKLYKNVSTGYVYLDSVTAQRDSLVEWYSVSRVEKDSVITEFLLKIIRSIADYEKDNLLIKSQKMKELYDSQEK